ncbi:MAG: hypothetical protein K2H91_07600 [Lachnospiraceae bacterium]|nr:hypothetical protein [Lachnospiraceae bacterium]
MKVTEEILKAKSVHIFAWPFRFETGKGKELKKNIRKKGWRRKYLDVMNEENTKQESIDCFMLHQYLSQSAREIFIKRETDICRIYEYPLNIEKNYQYYIKKGDETYYLPIATIELHLYDYGVGIVFIQVWNTNHNINQIKKINDYGRRVSAPYLAEEGMLCADCLGILIDDLDKSTDFKTIVNEYIKQDQAIPSVLLKPAEFLYDILNCNLEKRNGVNDISVFPLADDRMFACSIIRDTELSGKIKKGEVDEKQLYPILFVDYDDATCQNKEMRRKLFEDAIYPRWSDYGTLYGATSYSLCCITTQDEGINASVVRPFLIEYSYFISLVLAQRIGIMSFTVQAGNIIAGIGGKCKIIKRRKKKGMGYWQAAQLSQLQKQYIDFKNRLFILEVSNQEQGIEIYKLLQKQMLVQDEQEILDGKLQSLYEAANINIGNRLAVIGIVLAAAALFPDLGTFLENVFFQVLRYIWSCIMQIL